MRKAACLIVLVMVFGACSSSAETYEDVEAVVEAMEDEGIQCDDLETTDEFGNESDALVTERGICLVGKDRVVVSMFENDEDREDWVAVGKLLGKVAVGENWVVGSDSQEIVEEVADKLGATLPADNDDNNEEG